MDDFELCNRLRLASRNCDQKAVDGLRQESRKTENRESKEIRKDNHPLSACKQRNLIRDVTVDLAGRLCIRKPRPTFTYVETLRRTAVRVIEMKGSVIIPRCLMEDGEIKLSKQSK